MPVTFVTGISGGDAFPGALGLGAAAVGPTTLAAGGYPVAANLTIASAIAFAPGAVLTPAAGVVVSVNGPLSAGLYQIFDVTAGGRIRFAPGTVEGIHAEWFGASPTASAAANAAAIQAAINTSLDIADLTEQPTRLVAPVMLNAVYPVTTVYLPRFHELRGQSIRAGFSSAANAPMLVLGRSLAETGWLDSTLVNIALTGDVSKAAQHGIACGLTGAAAYVANLDWRQVSVRDVGGDGVHIIADHVAGMIIRMDWDKVRVVNAQGYAVRIKVGVFNVAHCNDGLFSDCGNGFLVEDIGSGATASETILFTSTQFESLGKPLGGAMAVGAFGFRSTMYTGHYEFDGCYFEGNGNAAADTTGSNIDVRAPWMLHVHDSLLVASNNQVIMRYGGQARLGGNFISGGANLNALFLFDQPQPGSDYSNFHLDKNKFDAAYTDAQLVKWTNGALTTVTGYRSPRNYLFTPPRARHDVLRDGGTVAVDDGAIGYGAVKRLANNAGGATAIVNNGIASICLNTVHAMVMVTEWGLGRMGLFLLTAGGGLTLVAQRGASFTVTKDTATSLNVYNDAGTGTWVVQNTLGATAYLAVRFFGCEPMEHADDGFYEAQFA